MHSHLLSLHSFHICLFLDWSIDDVVKFIAKQFGDKIADKFREEEVNGCVLLTERMKNETTMERLLLVTVGKQELFKSIVDRLKG
jgi:hypothetical protein